MAKEKKINIEDGNAEELKDSLHTEETLSLIHI